VLAKKVECVFPYHQMQVVWRDGI